MIPCDTGRSSRLLSGASRSITRAPNSSQATTRWPATTPAGHGVGRDRILPGAVRQRCHEARWLAAVAQGDFEPIDLTVADYARMADLVEQYDDLGLGTTDASVLAIAERLGITEIATLDRRHFAAVRPRHADHFALLPGRLR